MKDLNSAIQRNYRFSYSAFLALKECMPGISFSTLEIFFVALASFSIVSFDESLSLLLDGYLHNYPLFSDGILLKEVDRLLRPNGYFVYSAPPAYRKDKDYPIIWDKLVNLTAAMCWKLIARQVQTAIWLKPEDDSCRKQNAERNLLSICDAIDDSVPSWKTPMRNCLILSTEQSNFQRLPPRPDRLSVYSKSLEKIGQLVFLTCTFFSLAGFYFVCMSIFNVVV